MKNFHWAFLLLGAFTFGSCSSSPDSPNKELANQILNDKKLAYVDSLAKVTIQAGFNAGNGYSQIWARDMNSFVELAVDVKSKEEIHNAILLFFALQQKNGEMVDGYVVKEDFTWGDDHPYYSDAAPDHVAFKNTVETDQETSLIQLLGKYILKSGDYQLLDEVVDGKTVRERIKDMIDYLLAERYNEEYGLLWGAMTADWGDVQPNDDFGCDWNDELSHEAIDAYDNAMLIIALDYLAKVDPNFYKENKWDELRASVFENTRKHLWDAERQKFRPHVYPNGSPIVGFDEDEIFYHGGTAVAIEAGLLSKDEIAAVNKTMLENVKASGMPSIGLTLHPPYPEGFFHGWMSAPYYYQNGGDWTWFGGRMIQQLIANGFIEEAYAEVQPMLDRVVKNGDFFEWYAKGGVPSGSANFKGAAGVLSTAVEMFNAWAEENK